VVVTLHASPVGTSIGAHSNCEVLVAGEYLPHLSRTGVPPMIDSGQFERFTVTKARLWLELAIAISAMWA
jgi:hypothetical protein